MKPRPKFVFLLLFIGIVTSSLGQIEGLYPDNYSSYFFNPSLLNPAYIHPEGKSNIKLQSKVRSGVYSDIYSVNASFDKVIKNQSGQWHNARLLLNNEKEGEYISTPRVYGNYSLGVQLNDEMMLMAGIAVGLVNPNFRTPTNSTSNILPDGAVGLLFRYNATSIGVSSKQVFNNAAKDESDLQMKRYYTTHADHVFTLSPYLKLKAYLSFIIYSEIPVLYNLTSAIITREELELGAGYTNRGLYLYSFIVVNPRGDAPFKIGMLYNSTFLDRAPVLGGSFELSLAYDFR